MLSSKNKKQIQIQQGTSDNWGDLAFHTDIKKLIFFSLLGQSNKTINALKRVNRSFYHFINERNQSEIHASIPVLRTYFENNPGCNAVSFNARARYIPKSVLTEMLTNKIDADPYMLKANNLDDLSVNECNLKAFLLGSVCQDENCKDCANKSEKVQSPLRENHNCRHRDCGICLGRFDYNIVKSPYTNIDCLVLGAHQDVLTKLSLNLNEVMHFARMTQNIDFILFMCAKVGSDVNETLRLTLNHAVASKNNQAILAIKKHLPDAIFLIAMSLMHETFKKKQSPHMVLAVIEETIKLKQKICPKASRKIMLSEILTHSHRMEVFSEGCNRIFSGPLLHYVLFFQDDLSLQVVLDLYDKEEIDMTRSILECHEGIEIIKLSPMDCAVSSKKLDNVALMMQREALTLVNIAQLYKYHSKYTLLQWISYTLASSISQNKKQHLYNHFLDYISVHVNKDAHLDCLSYLIAFRKQWGEFAEQANLLDLIMPANTWVTVFCKAAVWGWDPNTENDLQLLSPEIQELLDQSQAKEIYANRGILQLVLHVKDNINVIQLQATIQNLYFNNHNSDDPKLLPYLIMAWMVHEYPDKFIGNEWRNYIIEAKTHYSIDELIEGISILKLIAGDSEFGSFEHIAKQDHETKKCSIM